MKTTSTRNTFTLLAMFYGSVYFCSSIKEIVRPDSTYCLEITGQIAKEQLNESCTYTVNWCLIIMSLSRVYTKEPNPFIFF
jgi:hypothetical protein